MYAETADGRYVLFIITVADTEYAFDRLIAGLSALPMEKNAAQKRFSSFSLPPAQNKCSPGKAARGTMRCTPFMRSAGYVSAVSVGVYPPGVPVIMPGQTITLEAIAYIDTALTQGYEYLRAGWAKYIYFGQYIEGGVNEIHKHFFDWDGTLVDSKEGLYNATLYMLEKIGVREDNPKRIIAYFGAPVPHILKEVYGITGEKSKEGYEAFRDYTIEKGFMEYTPHDGAVQMIRDLKDAGANVYIATCKPETTGAAGGRLPERP